MITLVYIIASISEFTHQFVSTSSSPSHFNRNMTKTLLIYSITALPFCLRALSRWESRFRFLHVYASSLDRCWHVYKKHGGRIVCIVSMFGNVAVSETAFLVLVIWVCDSLSLWQFESVTVCTGIYTNLSKPLLIFVQVLWILNIEAAVTWIYNTEMW